MPTQRVLTTISVPPALFREAKKIAEKESRTTSEVFRESFRQYLWFRQWEKLRKYGAVRTSFLGMKPEDSNEVIHEFRRGTKTKGRRRH